mmetsp:Transcript_4412/g.12438  ORF Transcript_4412/g.12438 Transcript_4412/m.12438 type:complete len:433 (-) Transcript_4412:697-1995(-)
MAATGTFGVVGVDCPALHGGDGVIHEARLVQSVRMDSNLDIVVIGKSQRGIDRRWGRSPVLVKLEAGGSSPKDRVKNCRVGRIALAGEAKVQGQAIGGLEHHLDLRGGRSARRGGRTGRGSGATSVHGRNARGDGLVALLRADPVNVRVDTSGRQDQLLPGNHFRGIADDHVGIDAAHHIGIPCFADAHNLGSLDADVGLDDAQDSINDECVGNDGVKGIVGMDSRGLSHALTKGLAPTELALVAKRRIVLLHPDGEAGISQNDAIALGGSVHIGVGAPLHHVGPARRRRLISISISTSRRSIAKPTLFHPSHDLVGPVFAGHPVRQAVPSQNALVACHLDEGHRLGLPGLEPDRRPRRDVEAHPDGGPPIEDERLVGLDEGVVRPHLDRPVAGVGHRQLDQVAVGVDGDGPQRIAGQGRTGHEVGGLLLSA